MVNTLFECLIGYVDKMDKQFEQIGADRIHRKTQMVDGRYETLMDLKKFTLEDILIYFINNEIDGFTRTRWNPSWIDKRQKYWKGICEKYPEYIDTAKVMDYFARKVNERKDGL